MPRCVRVLAVLAALGAASLVAVAQEDRDADVSAAVKRLKYDLPRAKTLEERLEVAASIPEISDPRLVKALIEALEQSLKASTRIQKELDKVEERLREFQGRKLLEAEWQEKDRLDAEAGEISRRAAREDEVARTLVAALAKQSDPEAFDSLEGLAVRHRSWRVRAEILTAFGRMPLTDRVKTALVLGTRDEDPRVRLAAVEELGRLAASGVDEYLIDRLRDEEWPVRSAAAAALARTKSPDSVGPLILVMGESDGRMREELAHALEQITGQTLGLDVRAWRDWWVEHYSEPLDPASYPRLDRQAGVSYHGITVNSLSLLFVVDVSDSMNESAAEATLPEEGVPERDNVERSKYDVVVQELVRTIKALPEEATFNLILYNHEVRRWEKKMQPATKKSKNDALAFLLAERPSGGTNISDALELAFETAGIGAQDRYYRPAFDTILFLSDGAPSAGRITDTKEILAEVGRWNRFRKIVIHTIGVGKLHDRPFMRSLAQENGGTYVERL